MTIREEPASTGQRLLWFLERYRDRHGALNCPTLCRLRGAVDSAVVDSALSALVERHEALRTTFTGKGRELTQAIGEPIPVRANVVDLSGRSDAASVAFQEVYRELRTPIDATVRPLRAVLWKLGDREAILCLNVHNMLCDLWSSTILLEDFAALLDGRDPEPVDWQFADFAAAERRYLAGPQGRRHREYWEARLAGLQTLELPLKPLEAGVTGKRTSRSRTLGQPVSQQLAQLARDCHTTVFAVLLACFYVLLHRLSGQTDLSVASLFANRSRRETQRTVGQLTNLLVLRSFCAPDDTFTELVGRAHEAVVGAFTHQGMPYHLLRTKASGAGTPVDSVVFQAAAAPIERTITAGDIAIEALVPDVLSRFDLEFAVMPSAHDTAVRVFFTEQRLDPGTADAMLADYAEIAAAVAAAPGRRIRSLG
ncbi:condensation domain-containing protein [Nocardia iowensis]|uniref:Condensation domain-containing protein n=1 Tax=Nocardia iowensis TaxID=204891 RepID=A0ABX8RJ08_NOCIO|nr:condensation domain-containing protein [Nocardia iowensis]QXN88440.1 hypothetical protein KV110_22855 [Nocardia iowensis]